jgi:arginine decarboxylase
MSEIPTHMFFTKGVGIHANSLESFEAALRVAGIAHVNIVRVSSIFPPACKIIARDRGIKRLAPGQIVHAVLAESRTDEPNRLCSAGVGLAIPADKAKHGYISEHHGYGLRVGKLVDLVEDMAASMLATTLGLQLDPDTAYDERQEIYRTSGLIVRTRSAVQTCEGDKNGLWTTALAAAVFLR